MKKTFLLILVVSLAFASSGCIHRRLTIKSDPPDATVYFNGKEKGSTPLEFDFMWYHPTHKVRLEKEGYETLNATESIMAPQHLWIPLDLIAELMPRDVEDHREFSYKLIPVIPEEELTR